MSGRIALPGDMNGIAAAQQAMQAADAALAERLYCAALSGTVAADVSKAVTIELARRAAEGVDPKEPMLLAMDPGFAAKAALAYAKAGFSTLRAGK